MYAQAFSIYSVLFFKHYEPLVWCFNAVMLKTLNSLIMLVQQMLTRRQKFFKKYIWYKNTPLKKSYILYTNVLQMI